MSQTKSRSTSSPEAGSKTPAKPATLARAVSLHMEGKLKEGLEEINRTLEGGDGSLETFSAKAQIQFELEMFEDAAKSYAKVLSLTPKHAGANFNLAVCLEKLGRWQEAIDFFKKAAAADPNRLETPRGLAICQLHLDKTDDAAASFDKVLSQQPDHPTALFGKAVMRQ